MSDFDTKLAEIRRLLAEAYEHYFENSDGYCKSSEGAITIHYPSFFWREPESAPTPIIEIYSYVLGPSRSHRFNSIDQALHNVRIWHKQEMATDYREVWS